MPSAILFRFLDHKEYLVKTHSQTNKYLGVSKLSPTLLAHLYIIRSALVSVYEIHEVTLLYQQILSTNAEY